MNSFRQKWAAHKTYKRLQKLWNEYKAISNLDDRGELAKKFEKLSEFLDHFEQAYKDWTKAGIVGAETNLDKIYGDLTDVLMGLLNVIEDSDLSSTTDSSVTALAELVNKALNIAEVILKDEKYRLVVANTPDLINRILLLLEKVDSNEAKTLVLRLVSTLGANDESKLAIGKGEGFRKIMRMLLDADAELSGEILRTIKHFVCFKDDDDDYELINNGLQSGEELGSKQSANNGGFKPPRNQGLSKVSELWTDIQQILINEVSRAFSKEISSSRPEKDDNLGAYTESMFSFIPSSEMLEQATKKFHESNILTLNKESTKESDERVRILRTTAIDRDGRRSSSFDLSKDKEIVKELMLVQGALVSLTSAFKEAAITHVGKLDILETLSKLLFRNPQSQVEFRNLDGYNILLKLFDDFVFTNVREKERFLNDCFNLLYVVTMDGSQDSYIENLDIFDVIISFALESRKVEVRTMAIKCIQDILSANSINAVVLKSRNFAEQSLNILKRLLTIKNGTDINLVFESIHLSVYGDNETSEEDMWNYLSEYLDSLCQLLEYFSITFYFHDNLILSQFMAIIEQYGSCIEDELMRNGNPIFKLTLTAVIKSCYSLVQDDSARKFALNKSELVQPPAFKISHENLIYYQRAVICLLRYYKNQLLSNVVSESKHELYCKDICEIIGQLSELLVVISFHHDMTNLADFGDVGGWDLILQVMFAVDSAIKNSVMGKHEEIWKIGLEIMEIYYCFIHNALQNETTPNQPKSENSPRENHPSMKWLLTLLRNLIPGIKNPTKLPIFHSNEQGYSTDIFYLSITEKDMIIFHGILLKCLSLLMDGLASNEPSYFESIKESESIDVFAQLIKSSNEIPTAYTSYFMSVVTCHALQNYVCGSEERKISVLRSFEDSLIVEHFAKAGHGLLIKDKIAWQLLMTILIEERSAKSKLSDIFSDSNWNTIDVLPLHLGLQEPNNCIPEPPELVKELENDRIFQNLNRVIKSPLLAFDSPPKKSIRKSIHADEERVNSLNNASLSNADSSESSLKLTSIHFVGKQESHKHMRHNSTGGTVNSDFNAFSPSIQKSDSIDDSSNEISKWISMHSSISEKYKSGLKSKARGSKSKSSKHLSSYSSASENLGAEGASLKDAQLAKRMSSRRSSSVSESRSNKLSFKGSSTSISDTATETESQKIFVEHLVSFFIRNIEAAEIVLKLLLVTDPIICPTHLEFFSFMILLCEAEYYNKKMLVSAEVPDVLIKLLLKRIYEPHNEVTVDWSMLLPYKELLVSLLSYDLGALTCEVLLEMASDPFKVYSRIDFGVALRENYFSPTDQVSPLPEFKGLSAHISQITVQDTQMQILDILKRIADRADPDNFFSFDGVGSFYQINSIDRFPALKYGYTFSCWLKITSFPCKETGLLCFEEISQSSALQTFELYFKEIPRLPRRQSEISSNVRSRAPLLTTFHLNEKPSKKFCLCLRSCNYPTPPEDLVFDGFDFGKYAGHGKWHHIAFTHSRSGLSLMVDGCMVQNCSTFSYPRIHGSSKNFSVALGRKAFQNHSFAQMPNKNKLDRYSSSGSNQNGWFSNWISYQSHKGNDEGVMPQKNLTHTPGMDEANGFYCGLIGSVFITEGQWTQEQALKVYSAGPYFAEGLSFFGIENRISFEIFPRWHDVSNSNSFHQFPSYSPAPPLTDTNIDRNNSPLSTSNLASMSAIAIGKKGSMSQNSSFLSIAPHMLEISGTPRLRISESLKNVDNDPLRPEGSPLNGCTVHNTTSMQDIIYDIEGFQFCFSIMELGPAQELAILQLFSNLFYQRPKLLEMFDMAKGWIIMLAILLKSPGDITKDIFDVLFEVSSYGGGPSRTISNLNCLEVCLDLIPQCRDAIQTEVLKDLVNILVESKESLILWKETFGLQRIFELVKTLSNFSQSDIFRLYRAIFPLLSMHELEKVLDTLAYDRNQLIDFKFATTEMLVEICQNDHEMLENLKNMNALSLFISLLDIAHEGIRINFLKLIGLILGSSPKNMRNYMTKISGFDAIRLMLSRRESSYDVIRSIFGIGLCWFKSTVLPDVRSQRFGTKMVSSMDSDGATQKFTDELIFPEVFKLVLDLLKETDDKEKVMNVISDMKKILTIQNMEVLWEFPWIEWIYTFSLDAIEDEINSVADLLYLFIQKMFVFDMQRKNFKQKNLLIEDDIFLGKVVDSVLDYFELTPCLAHEAAPDILKNMVQFYRHIEEHLPFNESVYIHFISVINAMAKHNNSSIRMQMKSSGLFDIRDDIVINILQTDVSFEQLEEFLEVFSFEQVADHPHFRDSNGLLLMINLFLRSRDKNLLQQEIGDIIVNTFLPFEENRKALAKIIDDQDFLDKILSVPSSSIVERNRHYRRKSSIPSTSDYPVETLSSFLEWFYSPSPDSVLKRTAVEQKIASLFLPLSRNNQKIEEKMMQKRNKRIKAMKDRQLKNAAQVNKSLTEFKAKSKIRLERSAAAHQEAQDELRKSMYERRKLGLELWNEQKTRILNMMHNVIYDE